MEPVIQVNQENSTTTHLTHHLLQHV